MRDCGQVPSRQMMSIWSLVVDDIWIPLGENMMIEQFKPIWNLAIDGFWNKDHGNRQVSIRIRNVSLFFLFCILQTTSGDSH